MFVLVRSSDGKFVAPPGQEHSYVESLQDAMLYPTREAAERHRCVGSEWIWEFPAEANRGRQPAPRGAP